MRKILIILCSGCLTYLSLGIFPYFPNWWGLSFAGIISVLSYKLPKAAFCLVAAVFGFTIAYYSLEFSLIYLIACFIFIIFTIRLEDFDVIFLIVAGCPLLANLVLLGKPFPIEFIVIFLCGLLLKGRSVSIISGCACLWASVLGIFLRMEFIGNLIIGEPVFKFFSAKSLPFAFQNFDWFAKGVSKFREEDLFKIIFLLGKFLLLHPIIILQVLVWSAGSYFISFFAGKRKWFMLIIGFFIGVCSIALLKYLIAAFYPVDLDSDYSTFFVSLLSSAVLIIIFFEISSLICRVTKRTVLNAQEVLQEAAAEDKKLSRALASDASGVGKLTLRDSLKMQKFLHDHIKKKFSSNATALDIDVVESTALKYGEANEDVVYSFTEYWKSVDSIMLRRRGRLLNRAGDGAIYIFQEPCHAVFAAQDVLRMLLKFNKKTSILKDDFRVRIGLDTGEVIHDDAISGSDVFSMVIDIAAHLQKIAPANGLFISERTYKGISDQKLFELYKYSEADKINIYRFKG
ncbi:MAG: adenylate/guanylate cyclase domain-containing protein [Candidatus Omnitrophota bacterium]